MRPLSKITNGGVQEGPYAYDTYGKPSDGTGSRYKYTGRRYDRESGLYDYRARDVYPGDHTGDRPRGYSAAAALSG